MITCTFLGHEEILDTDLHDRLYQALEALMDQDNQFTFFIRGRRGLGEHAIPTLLKLKQEHPKKQICLTLVETEDCYYSNKLCDKVVFPLEAQEQYLFPELMRLTRWCIDQSDCVICYLYEILKNRNEVCLKRAVKSNRRIIDITSEETKRFLQEGISQLPPKDRIVMEGIREGKSKAEMAAQIGVKAASFYWYAHRARKKLEILRLQEVCREMGLPERKYFLL